MGSKKCQVCDEAQSKYKCPNCFIPFCSLVCFKKHKEIPCGKPEPEPESEPVSEEKLAVGLMAAKRGGCWGRWDEAIVEVSVEGAYLVRGFCIGTRYLYLHEMQALITCPLANCFPSKTDLCKQFTLRFQLVCVKSENSAAPAPALHVEKPIYVDEPGEAVNQSQLESIASSSEILEAIRNKELQKLIYNLDSSLDAENELDKAMEKEEFRIISEKGGGGWKLRLVPPLIGMVKPAVIMVSIASSNNELQLAIRTEIMFWG
ncbi:hypothetical protein MTR67_025332 [Solanum verrucosum]|uniref:HIT-type domain-containing protein n=1 Tax=Solanum verrucosum TaxID=315347 RepID=A0AAF0QX05_SOLVR|nr:hypothetical protein MTR67_025332 [Solanum verrucosum]